MELRLETIKTQIEKMNKNQHIEVLKILIEKNVKINENKNGVYINISFLTEDIIEELESYIQYILDQEKSLQNAEILKKEFRSTYIENV